MRTKLSIVSLSIAMLISFTLTACENEAVDVKELTKKDDGIYYSKDDKPFSGKIKKFSDSNNILAEANLKDGKLHGSLKSYYESGKLKSEENFKDGKPHGVLKFYYENGNLWSEANYKDGEVQGAAKMYSEDGKLENESPAQEQAETESQKNNEGVFIFDKPELYNKVPDRYVFLALGKKPCGDISNPVKKQDCANNINVKDELSKAYSEKIGKTETFILSTRPGYIEPEGSIDGKLSSKPESKQLCEMNINFQNATQVFDKEEVMNIRKQIDEANADRKKNRQGKLNGSEIVSCLALFENKYIYEFGYNNFALFANKEAAMNFEPKGGSEVTLKLKKVVFFYNTDRTGSEKVYEIKIYDFVSQDLLARERRAETVESVMKNWSENFGYKTWDEASKICSSKGMHLPTNKEWDAVAEAFKGNNELLRKFFPMSGCDGTSWWSATKKSENVYYYYGYNDRYNETPLESWTWDKDDPQFGHLSKYCVRCVKSN
jgi:antitoxin component YwqK of YwqJK toxin-antitoxin module